MTQIKATQPELETSTNDQIVAEDLIEEVSIDGMCGVY
jgi:mycofactocin precursor